MKNRNNLILSSIFAITYISVSLSVTNAKSIAKNDRAVFSGGSNTVEIFCKNTALVNGQRLYVVKKTTPKSSEMSKLVQHPDAFFVDDCDKIRFNSDGIATVNLPTGEYQFSVLYANKDKFVALKTGFINIDSSKKIELKANKKTTKLKLKFGKKSLKFEEVCMKVDGYQTMKGRDFWSLDDHSYMIFAKKKISKLSSCKIFLSPKQKYSARIIASNKSKIKPIKAIVWETFSAKKPIINIKKKHYCAIAFKWAGKTSGYKKIKNPYYIFHTPEKDEIKIDISIKKTKLITNRKFCEFSYGYHTKSGEYLHYNRRTHTFNKTKATLNWGGKLKAKAYARVVMSWKEATPRSIIYGAYLYNKANDVVNTFVPHKDPKSPNQAKRLNDTKLAEIDFATKLIRIDGGEMPANPSWLTEAWVRQNIKDTDKMEQYFKVKLSYKLHGKKIEADVPLKKFVTWKSERFALEAPLEWEGRARAYLDKAERVLDLCNPVPLNGDKRKIPKFTKLFWTNNDWAGYSIGYPSYKRIQMGIFDLRRRQDLYQILGLFVHEVLHAYGYPHGGPHNHWIRTLEDYFMQHRQWMVDHPEYMPKQVKKFKFIESSKNDWGAERWDPKKTIKVKV